MSRIRLRQTFEASDLSRIACGRGVNPYLSGRLPIRASHKSRDRPHVLGGADLQQNDSDEKSAQSDYSDASNGQW
jgi:hypothetical protein